MRHVYIYVDDSDNAATEELLVSAFGRLAAQWVNTGAFAVNQRHERTPDLRPDDLPDWFIGLNVPLDQFSLTQAAELVPFARALARATGQEFVVGVASAPGITEDLIFLGPDAGEREYHDLLQHIAGP